MSRPGDAYHPTMPSPVDKYVGFDELQNSDLVRGVVYRGGPHPHNGADPLNRLLRVGNAGGFRYTGSVMQQQTKLVVLYSTGGITEWPDHFDPDTGDFIYYGDQRQPGRDIYDTNKKGNLLLHDAFTWAAGGLADRLKVPPFFVFLKDGAGRDVRFEGLMVPKVSSGKPRENLEIVQSSQGDAIIVNHRARFRMLPVDRVPREWIEDLHRGLPDSRSAPPEWIRWIESGPELTK